MLRFVVGRALLWSLMGAAIGAFGAIGLVGLIQTQLFGMDGGELWAYSLPFTIVTAMAVVAAYPVARRAAKLDPIEILREG